MAPENILVIGPSWVGDVVLSQSLYMTIKQRNPMSRIDVLAPAWSAPILARMEQVSSVIEMPLRHGELGLGRRRRLGLSIRGQYHRAIVLPNSFKSALVPWWAEIPKRSGFRGEMRYGLLNDMRILDRQALPRAIDRYVHLGHDTDAITREVPSPVLQVDANNTRMCVERLGLNCNTSILALMPGSAFGRSKCWPPEYFADIAKHYLRRGWQVWLLGSVADQKVSSRIAKAAPGQVIDLCGKTNLVDVIDLIAQAKLAITNDSGLMHIAAAVATPLVAVYGATSPEYTPPMSKHALTLWKGIECSPCYKRVCRYGHYRCLTEIPATEVQIQATCLFKAHPSHKAL